MDRSERIALNGQTINDPKPFGGLKSQIVASVINQSRVVSMGVCPNLLHLPPEVDFIENHPLGAESGTVLFNHSFRRRVSVVAVDKQYIYPRSNDPGDFLYDPIVSGNILDGNDLRKIIESGEISLLGNYGDDF